MGLLHSPTGIVNASMHPLSEKRDRLADVLRSALGGAAGAVVTLALILAVGLIAVTPLGVQAAPIGILASFTCVVVSAGLYSLLGRNALPAGSPTSATALIVATFVAKMAAGAPDRAAPELALQVIAALACTVSLMGLLQILAASLNLGRLVRFVPQPVLAGFMNGVVLLILMSQLPALLGLPQDVFQRQGWSALSQLQWGALALGLSVAALVWLLAWKWPKLPTALFGLLAGVGAYHGLLALWPGMHMGPTLGAIDATLASPGLLSLMRADMPTTALLQTHLKLIVSTAFILALVGSLESLLNLRANEQQWGGHHNERRELASQGLANLIGGALGALPMLQVRVRSAGIRLCGGHGRAGAIGAVLASAAMIFIGANWMAALPLAVLAGLMVVIARALIDQWSGSLWHALMLAPRRRAAASSLAIIALVCLTTAWWGPGAGVGLGLLLSIAVFLRNMNRGLVRSSNSALSRHSRRVYPAELQPALAQVRQRIWVLDLEGAFFFGSADRVAEAADSLGPELRFLVLDLHRVSRIDDTAALVLSRAEAGLSRRGVTLLLAGVGPGSAQRKQLQAFLSADDASVSERWFRDADLAIEHAELHLLAQTPTSPSSPDLRATMDREVPAEQSALMQGLDSGQCQRLTQAMQLRQLKAGQPLFQEGDAGDSLYVLTRGSISIVGAHGQRFVSYSPGTLFGELSFVDRQSRSAGALADSDSLVLSLSRDALDDLARSDPLLCQKVQHNIAAQMSMRLRAASDAWREAEA